MMNEDAIRRMEYRQGFEDGLRAFAWWKDGVQYVGTCGTTLTRAIEGIEEVWSFLESRRGSKLDQAIERACRAVRPTIAREAANEKVGPDVMDMRLD